MVERLLIVKCSINDILFDWRCSDYNAGADARGWCSGGRLRIRCYVREARRHKEMMIGNTPYVSDIGMGGL